MLQIDLYILDLYSRSTPTVTIQRLDLLTTDLDLEHFTPNPYYRSKENHVSLNYNCFTNATFIMILDNLLFKSSLYRSIRNYTSYKYFLTCLFPWKHIEPVEHLDISERILRASYGGTHVLELRMPLLNYQLYTAHNQHINTLMVKTFPCLIRQVKITR